MRVIVETQCRPCSAGSAAGATQPFATGLAKVGNPPRADLYSESTEGPVWGIKGRFLRPTLNGRCRIRKPPPDGAPPGDRRFFDRRTAGQQPVRRCASSPAKFEVGVSRRSGA